jgi:hypothetical protein
MINSSGFLNRTLLLSSLFLLFTSVISPVFSADTSTSLAVTYEINSSGDLSTDLLFTIENNSIIPIVVNYYTVTLPFSSMNDLQVTYSGRKLERSTHKQNVGTDVVINFDSAVIPVNDDLLFRATFNRSGYIDTDETVSYISLPSEFPDISFNSSVVKYPSAWGTIAWSSVATQKSSQKDSVRTIQFSALKESHLNFILGDELTYGFEIVRTLTNSDTTEKLFDVSIPGWTHSQKVLFSEIEPIPDLVTNDKQGNLTFSYLLEAGRSQKVTVEGEILITESTGELDLKGLEVLIENSGYWQLNSDSEYKRVALYLKQKGLDISSQEGSYNDLEGKDLRARFVKEAYIYVINRFDPAQISETSLENPLRAGATLALQKEGGVVPEDYVDLLISILRHFGVPSKMVVGYIPESAGYKTKGFFHSWVEYWQQDESSWKILDPALDDSLDQSLYNRTIGDRITLLEREESSILPKLTYFTDEELRIEPVISTTDEHIDSEVELTVNSAKLTSKYIQAQLELTNKGTVPVLLDTVDLLDSDNREVDTLILTTLSESVIVPGATLSVPITLNNFAKDSLNQEMTMQYVLKDPAGENTTTVETVSIQTVNYWWWDWLIKLISFIMFSLAFAGVYFIFRRVKKIWS